MAPKAESWSSFVSGSSKTLSLDQFIELCEGLRSFDDYNFIIHCAKNDTEKAEYILKNMEIPDNITTIIAVLGVI